MDLFGFRRPCPAVFCGVSEKQKKITPRALCDFAVDYYLIDLLEITSENVMLLRQILREGVLLYEFKWQYYSLQRLHWRFLVEDNYKNTLNYSNILQRKLQML